MKDVDATKRSYFERHEALVERSLDQDIVGRRGVVVTVAHVAAANDPCQLRHVH